MKLCPKCGIEHPFSEFHANRLRNGYQSWCKGCQKKRKRSKRPPEQVFKNRLSHKYGLTVEQWEEMSLDGCAICGLKDNLCVDHDHTTGEVRSVLCKTCNTGLGMFKDSPELLAAAAAYLTGE